MLTLSLYLSFIRIFNPKSNPTLVSLNLNLTLILKIAKWRKSLISMLLYLKKTFGLKKKKLLTPPAMEIGSKICYNEVIYTRDVTRKTNCDFFFMWLFPNQNDDFLCDFFLLFPTREFLGWGVIIMHSSLLLLPFVYSGLFQAAVCCLFTSMNDFHSAFSIGWRSLIFSLQQWKISHKEFKLNYFY